MEINKVCQFCNNRFVAKKTTTKCCSDDCAKKYYKLKKRNEKIQQSNNDFDKQIKNHATSLNSSRLVSAYPARLAQGAVNVRSCCCTCDSQQPSPSTIAVTACGFCLAWR